MEWFMFGDLTLTDLETGRAGLSASAELLVLLTTKHSGGFMVVGLGSAVKFGCLDSVGVTCCGSRCIVCRYSITDLPSIIILLQVLVSSGYR